MTSMMKPAGWREPKPFKDATHYRWRICGMKTLPTDIVISAGCINEEDIASSYSKAYMNGQRALNGFIWGILEVAAVFSPMESELLSRHNFRDGIVESGWEKEDDPRR